MFKEFKTFLEIDKPNRKFRDKMKGFLFKYWDDNEKIQRYAPLTNDEYQRVKKQAKIFKSMREKSAKEKENKKEKLRQELFNKKKEEFLINNKKLIKKIKDKEKKSYILLKNLNIRKKNEIKEKFNLENIKSNTYEGIANSDMNLNKEEKEEIFINDEEENSDDELFKNKKADKKVETKEEKNEEVFNLNNKENNEKEINLKNYNNVNNSRNITTGNDNLSEINTYKTNASYEINNLKMNLRPKKKENIYFSFNNKTMSTDINEEMKQKEPDKKNEEKNKINNETNNTNKNIRQRYQEMYQNQNNPSFNNNNDFKKDHSPLNINSNNNNNKGPLGIYKNSIIGKEIKVLLSLRALFQIIIIDCRRM